MSLVIHVSQSKMTFIIIASDSDPFSMTSPSNTFCWNESSIREFLFMLVT